MKAEWIHIYRSLPGKTAALNNQRNDLDTLERRFSGTRGVYAVSCGSGCWPGIYRYQELEVKSCNLRDTW
jgi:hypothetical protein